MNFRHYIFFFALLALSACGEPESTADTSRAEVAKKGGTQAGELIASLTDDILDKPNNPNLYIRRALAYSDNNNFNMALKDVDRALTIDSTVSFFHATRGEILFRAGDLRNARISLERAVSYDPENTEALLKLGEIYFLLRRYEESVNTIDEALVLNERLPQGYFLKGFLFKEIGDTSRAISSFQTATEINPDFYEAYMELANLHSWQGNPLALDYLNTAIEIRPKSVEAWYNKGVFYQSTGYIEEAMESYQELVKRDSDGFLGYYNMGYLYLTEYLEYETAIAYFDTVLTIQPMSFDALYNKGLCYEEMGDTKMAEATYREVLANDPQHTLAAMGMERLLD